MMANFWPPSLNNESIFFLIKYINGSEIQFVISFVFLYITTSEGIGNLEATFPPIASHFPCKLGNSQEQFSCLIKVNFSRLLFLESFDYLEKKTPLKSKKRGNYIWGFILILILKDSEEELILFCGNTAGEQWDFHLYANRLKTHRFKNLKRDLIP